MMRSKGVEGGCQVLKVLMVCTGSERSRATALIGTAGGLVSAKGSVVSPERERTFLQDVALAASAAVFAAENVD
jgi:hypothetical protein